MVKFFKFSMYYCLSQYWIWVSDLESFVDAIRAAEFLSVTPRYILGLARKGHIPAHPLGSGQRRIWRFRLSELSRAFAQPSEHNHSQQPSTAKRS